MVRRVNSTTGAERGAAAFGRCATVAGMAGQGATELIPPAGSPLRATAIVGLGSATTLGFSVLTAKAYAILVGPEGVGLLALLQALLTLGVMLFTAGLVTSAVRPFSRVAASSAAVTTVLVRGLIIVVLGGVLGSGLLLLLREPVATGLLGGPERTMDVTWLALALLLSVVGALLLAALTGLQMVGAVVKVNIATSLTAAVLGVLVVGLLGISGVALAVLFTAAVQLAMSVAMYAGWTSRMSRGMAAIVAPTTREMLLDGLPVAASRVVGHGALFVVPVIVLQLATTADVGLYRAAAAISVGYLSFFLAALTQDYLPRLAREPDGAGLRVLVERRMRLMMALGAPLVLVLLGMGPWLLELLYTREFVPAFGVLKWQLVGDLVRIPAWVLSFVLLARARTGRYLVVELVGGVSVVLACTAGLALIGLEGAGAGYAAAQLAYFVVVWLAVSSHGVRPGRLQAVIVSVAAVAASIALVPIGAVIQAVLWTAMALGVAALAWPRVYRSWRAGDI